MDYRIVQTQKQKFIAMVRSFRNEIINDDDNHDVPDFWDVVGRNTDYVEDPEEAMASNFWLAFKSLDDGYADYKSPEILERIIDCLKAGN